MALDILGGQYKVRVIIPDDLIGLKVQSSSNDATRHHQDMADIEAILRLHQGKLNMAVIREYFALFEREKELNSALRRVGYAESN